MDAPSLSPERSRELADLRRRAYGPHADIQRDPAAQRRLSELEELARIPSADPAPAQGVPEPAPPEPDLADFEPLARRPMTEPPDRVEAHDRAEASALPIAEEERPSPEAAESAATVTAARKRAWWRRIPLWSVTALAGIAAGIAIGLAWPTDSEPPPTVTLDVDPGGGERGAGFAENLDYWGIVPGTLVPYEAFDVLQVWTGRSIDDSRCLMLSHEGGFLSATCGGAGLDPVLDFTVYDGMSLELDVPLPVGTVIRLVGRDGHVDVWVSVPGGQAGDAAATTSSRDSAASAA